MTIAPMPWPHWLPDHRRSPASRRILRERAARHPRFLRAIAEDARIYSQCRGEPIPEHSTVAVYLEAARLALVSDAFLAQAMYRAKARLRALRVPVLPSIAHRLAMVIAQVSIGDPVVVEAGVYLLHGQIVVDGLTEIRAGARLAPFVTIGLVAGSLEGPTIGADARIGTGSKILGPVTIGDRAVVGANAVVLCDVPAGRTAVGAPARVLDPSS